MWERTYHKTEKLKQQLAKLEYSAKEAQSMKLKHEVALQGKEAMEKLVRQGLQRIEALDFLKRDFPEFSCSIRTLDRRLRYFNIFYNDSGVKVDDVKAAVENELKGPGKLLGYRAMHKRSAKNTVSNLLGTKFMM